MSVIIKGDTTQLFGEHLPTPSIDKIEVKGTGPSADLQIYLSIHMPYDSTKFFASSTDAVESADVAYSSYMSALNYYVALSIPNTAGAGSWKATYEEIAKGNPDANLLAIAAGGFEFHTGIEAYTDAVTGASADYGPGTEAHAPILLFEVDFSSATPTQVFSEDGEEIWKYTVSKLIPLKDPYNSGLPTTWIYHDAVRNSWNAIANMYVYAFSSTINYRESVDSGEIYGPKYISTPTEAGGWAASALDELGITEGAARIIAEHASADIGTTAQGTVSTRPLLNLETSAIAYEKVFEDGALADKDSVEYFDSEKSPYTQTPLVAIDSAIYKIDKITHAQIVDKIQGVLDRYQVYYDKDRGYNNLKNMYNGISTIITTQANDPYLLPRLATFQKAWPHKLPAKPVGKLYKDFRKNIFAINKAIKNAQRLYPRIVYNAKIVDLRPVPVEEPFDPLYKEDWESSPTDYIYNTKFMGTKMNVYSDPVTSERKDVVYGMAFFDYEKALAYTSVASRAINVQKLELWGMPILYSQFYVSSARFERTRVTDAGKPAEKVYIISYMAGTIPDNSSAVDMAVGEYPLTKWVRIYDSSDSGNKKVKRVVAYGDGTDGYANALIGTPYYPDKPSDWEEAIEVAASTEIVETKSFGARTGTVDSSEGDDEFMYGKLLDWIHEMRSTYDVMRIDAVDAGSHEWGWTIADYFDGTSEHGPDDDRYDYPDPSAKATGDMQKPTGWNLNHATDEKFIDKYYVSTDWEGGHLYNTTWEFHLSRAMESYTVAGSTDTGFDAGLAAGYLTSTTLRPFSNVSPALGGDPLSPTIDNYRLMCFDLLDYQINSYADTYDFKISIVDKTSEILIDLINTFTEANDSLNAYYDLCIQQCSFNSTTGLFNEFFRENIVTYYEADMENAPWYRIPFIYCLHRDLHYNTYQGELSEIKKAAIAISSQIDPATGTLTGVESFQTAMTSMMSAIYEEGGTVYDTLTTLGPESTSMPAISRFAASTPTTWALNEYSAPYDMPEAYDTLSADYARADRSDRPELGGTGFPGGGGGGGSSDKYD